MFTYSTTGNEFTITITDSESGASCFMQGDEAAELVEQLENCQTDEQEQNLLGTYSEVMA